MASAKKEAKNYLGSVNDYINLKGLDQERTLANDVYNTNITSFQNAYNDLLNTLANNRNKAKTDFGSGRATVSENAYLQNRNDIANLASRGLNGGIAQLNKLGNRIETGRQFSNLANTYYNTMNEIDASEKTGTNQYNTQMETAKNTLNAALAEINSREKAGRNAYKAAVAQLAEQIQSRRAAQAAASAARAQANAQAKALKDQAYTTLRDSLIKALNGDTSVTNVGKVANDYASAIAKYTGKSTNRSQAMEFMYNMGLYNPNNWTSNSSTSKSSSTTKQTTTKKKTVKHRGHSF